MDSESVISTDYICDFIVLLYFQSMKFDIISTHIMFNKYDIRCQYAINIFKNKYKNKELWECKSASMFMILFYKDLETD